VYAFIDGPRNNSEIHLIDAVEKILLEKKNSFMALHVERSEKNLSCDAGLRIEVTKMLSKFEDVIILEDDDVPSKFFLSYMKHIRFNL